MFPSAKIWIKILPLILRAKTRFSNCEGKWAYFEKIVDSVALPPSGKKVGSKKIKIIILIIIRMIIIIIMFYPIEFTVQILSKSM